MIRFYFDLKIANNEHLNQTNEKLISNALDFDNAMEAFLGVSPPKDEGQQKKSDDSNKKKKETRAYLSVKWKKKMKIVMDFQATVIVVEIM